MLASLIHHLRLHPRRLFLLDGGGALLSALLLGLVLPSIQPLIGMPVKVLYLLAALPVGFAVYDILCYLRQDLRPAPWLRGIAFANLGYCVLSIGMLVHHFPQLTALGVAYFVGECVIVVAIAYLELRTAATLT